MNKQKFSEEFICKLGIPDNKQKLEEYINFCLDNNNVIEEYFERRHQGN